MSAPFTIAVWDYDRTRPLIDGRIAIEGVDPTWVWDIPIETMFARAIGNAEFDVSELSFSNFLAQTARGECAYVGLPIFPSRSFRHGAWFVSASSGIETPADLTGRRIGVREYSMTAAVVARGILSDEYGIGARDVTWVVGDVDERERDTIPLPALPEGFRVEGIEADALLMDKLIAGEIDALLAYKPPRRFVAGDPMIRRLFADPKALEMDFARRTGIFPIMHLMGIRKDVAKAAPWLAGALVDAFTAAKDHAMADLAIVQALKTALPWSPQARAETVEVLGEDYWPYGIARNIAAIEALARWHHEQGLSDRPLQVQDMFMHSTLDG